LLKGWSNYLKHLIEVDEGLKEKGAGFISLREAFDATSSGSKLIFYFLNKSEWLPVRSKTISCSRGL
jgi:hypothetical protein